MGRQVEYKRLQWLAYSVDWATRVRSVSVGIPVLLVIIATVFVYGNLRSVEQAKLEVLFDGQTRTIQNGLTEEFNVYLEIVQSIASFYSASGQVDRDGFNTFVARDLSHYKGIQALEWVPRVTQEDRADYEQSLQEAGFKGFQFKQWRPELDQEWVASDEKWSDEYYPVYFMQPHSGNERALGIDLGSNPTRRKALNLAFKSGNPAATARITLAQETGDQSGILIFVPVILSNNTKTPHENLQGFALGVFRVGDIVESVMAKRDHDNVELWITDESATIERTMLFDTRTLPAHSNVRPKDKTANEQLQIVYQYEVGGRQWNFHFVAKQEYASAHSSNHAWLVLICGMLLAVVIGVILNFVIVRLSEQTVEELRNTLLERDSETKERHRAEQELELQFVKLQERSAELESSQLATLNMMEDIEASRSQLGRSNEALKQSNHDLEQFAFIASHDLQEPLRKVASFCGLLRQEYFEQLDDDGRQYVEFAIDGATRMRSLIQDLLLYSKIGSVKNRSERIESDAALRTAILDLDVAIVESNAIITYDSLPNVVAEERELAQLFQNLIGNAIKYRTDKTPEIHVAAVSVDEFWQFSISDNGIGIEPEYREQIFGIFKRLHTRNEYSGTGIGLAICKRIIDQLNGRIWVEPTTVPGCKICFTIPKKRSTVFPIITSTQFEGSSNEYVSVAKNPG